MVLIPAAGRVPEGIIATATVATPTMIPVAGRPVIQWMLSALHRLGLRRARIALPERGLFAEDLIVGVFGRTWDLDIIAPASRRRGGRHPAGPGRGRGQWPRAHRSGRHPLLVPGPLGARLRRRDRPGRRGRGVLSLVPGRRGRDPGRPPVLRQGPRSTRAPPGPHRRLLLPGREPAAPGRPRAALGSLGRARDGHPARLDPPAGAGAGGPGRLLERLRQPRHAGPLPATPARGAGLQRDHRRSAAVDADQAQREPVQVHRRDQLPAPAAPRPVGAVPADRRVLHQVGPGLRHHGVLRVPDPGRALRVRGPRAGGVGTDLPPPPVDHPAQLQAPPGPRDPRRPAPDVPDQDPGAHRRRR